MPLLALILPEGNKISRIYFIEKMSQTKFFLIIGVLIVLLLLIIASTFITNATWIIGAVIVDALWIPIGYYVNVRTNHKGAKICVYFLFVFVFNWILFFVVEV